ncbi:MAG: ABC transporter permease, partial [Oscillospiraceae bacterium]|nr:ABC transporter permease [Oscillospiraceae bacterium]
MENIRLAFQGIWSHKMRSVLTMLGIIIGIASIITIVSTIKGTNEQIKQNLIGSGSNVVTVQLYQDSYVYDLSYNPLPNGVKVIEEPMRAQLEALDGVEKVSFYNARLWSDNVSAGKLSFSGNVIGVDEAYFEVYDYHLSYGRNFTEEDYSLFRKVVILDKKAASTLFPGEYPIGQTIEIAGEAFTVVGMLESGNAFTPRIETYDDYYMYTDTSGGSIFMPNSCWPIVYRFDEPQSVAVRAKSTDDMTKAGKGVADTLTLSQIEGATVAGDVVMEEGAAEDAVEGGSSGSQYSYRSEDLLEQAQQL